jgi:uncharacterized protein YoxC
MNNEGFFLLAFILLAIILLAMIAQRREHFDPPQDPLIRMNKLEEDVQLLDERTDAVEQKLKKQDEDINAAQSDVDTAATSINMIT